MEGGPDLSFFTDGFLGLSGCRSMDVTDDAGSGVKAKAAEAESQEGNRGSCNERWSVPPMPPFPGPFPDFHSLLAPY